MAESALAVATTAADIKRLVAASNNFTIRRNANEENVSFGRTGSVVRVVGLGPGDASTIGSVDEIRRFNQYRHD
jgi:hypothetical protein